MSKRAISIAIFGLVLMFVAPPAMSYEGETHGLITYQAYNLSGLSRTGQGTIVNRLGLDRLDPPSPFGAYWLAPLPDHGTYYDNVAVSPPQYPSLLDYSREPNSFEQCEMQNLLAAGWINSTDPMVAAGQVANLPIQNWLLRGVLREDDLAASGYFLDAGFCGRPDPDPAGDITRVFNHFYDPINNQPLTVASVALGEKSVDWALGFVDSFAATPAIDTNRRNHFTYEDARENMWLALVGERGRLNPPYTALAREEDTQERIYRWATVFRSLGDVIHLLQDGAQPQHVRNDQHSPGISSKERQAFEGYTNGRVLKQAVSSQNAYVRGFYSGNQDPQLPPIVTGSYNEVMFATPLRFYTTRLANDGATTLPDGRYGMMDYANRGFFTGGTLPGDSDFLEPPQNVAGAGYATSTVGCSFSQQLPIYPGVDCVHVTHAVEDNVQSSYADQLPSGFTTPPLAQVSALALLASEYGITAPNLGYAIGLEEMQTQANLTIPRAIAYSAGLIDYFFRGKIAITPPPAGIYAIFDHSQTHTVDADGYPRNAQGNIFGFTQVQMNVLNATAPVTESGSGVTVNQRMTNGQLVAVARYHRNKCYQPDLSGEIAENYDTGQMHLPANCDVIANRTAYQEISVSAPLVVDASGNVTVGGQPYDLNGGTPILALFDFSADPIPINATDLFLQVVYRGNMGDTVGGVPMIEPDAIAVGTVDVSEPTYGAVFDEDYFLYQSQWLTAAQAQPLVPPGTDVNPAPLVNVQYCIDDHLVGEKGLTNQPSGGLQPARQIRYAVILDISQSHTHTDIAQFWINNQPDTQVLIVNAPVFQRDAQASMEQDPLTGPGAYAPDAQTWGRGVVLGSWETSFYQGYNPIVVTSFPQNAPLPNGFLPDPSDTVYLNHPDAALCNQAPTRPERLQAGGRNPSAPLN